MSSQKINQKRNLTGFRSLALVAVIASAVSVEAQPTSVMSFKSGFTRLHEIDPTSGKPVPSHREGSERTSDGVRYLSTVSVLMSSKFESSYRYQGERRTRKGELIDGWISVNPSDEDISADIPISGNVMYGKEEMACVERQNVEARKARESEVFKRLKEFGLKNVEVRMIVGSDTKKFSADNLPGGRADLVYLYDDQVFAGKKVAFPATRETRLKSLSAADLIISPVFQNVQRRAFVPLPKDWIGAMKRDFRNDGFENPELTYSASHCFVIPSHAIVSQIEQQLPSVIADFEAQHAEVTQSPERGGRAWPEKIRLSAQSDRTAGRGTGK